jgi:hypothetical protein
MRIEDYEAQEIADFLLNIENPEEDSEITEEALFNNYGIGLETFTEIVNKLFETLDLGTSPLTNEAFVGFSKGNQWLAKKSVNSQFIGAIINWCTDGSGEIEEGKRGYVKTITSGGKPKFDITITRPNEDYEEFEESEEN